MLRHESLNRAWQYHRSAITKLIRRFPEKLLITNASELGKPQGDKFYYPEDKRRTPECVQALRSAEQNLDKFWRAIDKLIYTACGDLTDSNMLGQVLSSNVPSVERISLSAESDMAEMTKAAIVNANHHSVPLSPLWGEMFGEPVGPQKLWKYTVLIPDNFVPTALEKAGFDKDAPSPVLIAIQNSRGIMKKAAMSLLDDLEMPHTKQNIGDFMEIFVRTQIDQVSGIPGGDWFLKAAHDMMLEYSESQDPDSIIVESSQAPAASADSEPKSRMTAPEAAEILSAMNYSPVSTMEPEATTQVEWGNRGGTPPKETKDQQQDAQELSAHPPPQEKVQQGVLEEALSQSQLLEQAPSDDAGESQDQAAQEPPTKHSRPASLQQDKVRQDVVEKALFKSQPLEQTTSSEQGSSHLYQQPKCLVALEVTPIVQEREVTELSDEDESLQDQALTGVIQVGDGTDQTSKPEALIHSSQDQGEVRQEGATTEASQQQESIRTLERNPGSSSTRKEEVTEASADKSARPLQQEITVPALQEQGSAQRFGQEKLIGALPDQGCSEPPQQEKGVIELSEEQNYSQSTKPQEKVTKASIEQICSESTQPQEKVAKAFKEQTCSQSTKPQEKVTKASIEKICSESTQPQEKVVKAFEEQTCSQSTKPQEKVTKASTEQICSESTQPQEKVAKAFEEQTCSQSPLHEETAEAPKDQASMPTLQQEGPVEVAEEQASCQPPPPLETTKTTENQAPTQVGQHGAATDSIKEYSTMPQQQDELTEKSGDTAATNYSEQLETQKVLPHDSQGALAGQEGDECELHECQVPGSSAKKMTSDDDDVIAVDSRALKVFRTVFQDAMTIQTPGEVVWQDFVHAMTSTGYFTAEKMYGSAWQFHKTQDAPVTWPVTRIQFYEPYPRPKMAFIEARRCGKWLNKTLGWEASTFVLKDKEPQ
ncbi:hypothetical protein CDD81_2638 [Ophiocordyceps australis]|uniref:Uncharacterized protein n=1 Tax=Ophiocordyceps australis TaxID=1399860 RepID=A0A2C5XX78_9HYPO|nr:hypothetical protein CDD81_2638 [Ophiocordyceps australis]